MNPIPFNYHDGFIKGFFLNENDRTVTVTVGLDPVWNKTPTSVASLQFIDIYNMESVVQFLNSVHREDNGGERIEQFDYSSKNPSQPGDLYFFITLEYAGSIEIHCKNIVFSQQ